MACVAWLGKAGGVGVLGRKGVDDLATDDGQKNGETSPMATHGVEVLREASASIPSAVEHRERQGRDGEWGPGISSKIWLKFAQTFANLQIRLEFENHFKTK